MTPGERFKNWLEGLSQDWAKRLRDWLSDVLAFGLELILDIVGKGLSARLDDIIDETARQQDWDDETRDKVKEFWKPGGEWGVMLGSAAGGAAVGGLISSTIGPLLLLNQYREQKKWKIFRLDPMSVITAWRRDKEKYGGLFEDLKDQGWNDDRIEALKFFTEFYPAPADLIRWQAREVFEPAMITKYGLDDEFGEIEKEAFYKAGMTDEQILNYWRAHWEHASWMQVVEMLHRGLVAEEDVYDWFRLVEIPPFWRDLLIKTAYTWPTRVDVRRWWDMRTIGEDRLRELYSGMGYRGTNLDDYVLWTKVYVAFPDLMARWSKGWITLDEVKSQLTGLGMPTERLEEFIQMKVKAEQPERVEGERALTKTDIYKGVKAGRITRGEAAELLMELGFDEDEADYLLEINIPPDEEEAVVGARKISKADILRGLKVEEITQAEAKTKLMDLRYSSSDAELLLKIYDAQVKVPEEPKLREASKADIVLGVTKGLIDQSEGYAMLLELGFTPEAAGFILMVKTEESPFSPINFAEFKDLTYKYKRAIGKEEKPMPEELKAAAAEVVRVTQEIEALNRSIVEEKRGLVGEEILPAEATRRLKGLQVKLHRAEAELARVKTEYESKLAEWRHGV